MTEQKRSKGDYLVDINEKTGHWEINPEKAIKNMKSIVIGFVIIAIIVCFVVQININTSNDLWNSSTLAVEIIFGIFIALVVYVYSKRQYMASEEQQKKIEKLVTDINNLEQKQENLRKTRKDIAERRLSIYFSFLFSEIEGKEKNVNDEKLLKKEKIKRIISNNESIRFSVNKINRVIDNSFDILDPEDSKNIEALCSLVENYSKSILERQYMVIFNTMIGHLLELKKKYPVKEFPKIRIADIQKDYLNLTEIRDLTDSYVAVPMTKTFTIDAVLINSPEKEYEIVKQELEETRKKLAEFNSKTKSKKKSI